MRIILLVLFSFVAAIAVAQDTSFRYRDSVWEPCTKSAAKFYVEVVKKDTLYSCRTYLTDSNTLCTVSTYADSFLRARIGLELDYYRSGKLEDSSFYATPTCRIYAYHFYETGKLFAYGVYNAAQDKMNFEAYDTAGKIMPGFVCEKLAVFPAGQSAWVKFIVKHVNTDFAARDYNNVQQVLKVWVLFLIRTDGSVYGARVIRSSGFADVDADALRVISKSPRWTPEVSYNKLVEAVRIQPIGYVLDPM